MNSADHLKAIEPELVRRNLLQEALKSDGDIQNEWLEFDDFPAL